MNLPDWLRALALRNVAGNPLWAWTAALGTALLVFAVLLALRRRAAARLAAPPELLESRPFAGVAGELLGATWALVLFFAGLYAGSLFLRLPPRVEAALRSALVVLALLQGGLWSQRLLSRWLRHRLQKTSDVARSTAVLMIAFGGKLAIWSLVLLLALENLGVDVTALIAGLGVGGIAVALAVQNVLGDLLGSVAIALDKPFEVGDFIIVGDMMGAVEHIGLKTTRVRSLFGEQIVFSNGDLLASRIRNFKRMRERRVAFSFGVTYDTPAEKLDAIPALVRGIVEKRADLRFDRAHFQKFGDFSLLFEVVYYVSTPDYNLYMDRQQEINMALIRAFEAEGVRFAFPTQTLHVRSETALGKPSP
jgi:small-conductance mechanosensitive channel